MKTKFTKIVVGIFAFVVVATTIVGVVTVIAFTGPTSNPGTAGFASPCSYALSKDDNCTFDRSADSLEAISEKIDTKFPQ